VVSLRPYQQDALDAVLAAVRTQRSVLLQAATGAGKTILFSALIRHCMERYKMRIGILAHREQLVRQAYDKLLKVWPEGVLSVGIACASASKDVDVEKPVVIGSPQTLSRRTGDMPAIHMLIVDECHRLPPANTRSQYGELISGLRQWYPEMRLVGVTATPFRLGHGYIYGDRCRNPKENWFEDLAYSIGTPELQEQGYLVPLKIWIAEDPDLSGVRTDKGEFNLNELGDAMSRAVHVHSAVQALAKYAPERRHVVVFACTIEHAEVLAGAFKAAGYRAEAVHSRMHHDERLARLAAFDAGELDVVVNVGVLTEGWDCTCVDCMLMCRPTKSAALYVQMVGRGLRTHPGKADCVMLDLSGNWAEHGDPADPRVTWGRHKAEPRKGRKCPQCDYVNKQGAMVCENCGYEWPEPETFECPRCRAENPLRAVACRNCGFIFNEASDVSMKQVDLWQDETPQGPMPVEVLSSSVDADFVSRKGNAMVCIVMNCSENRGSLPFQVREFLDVEGRAGPWGQLKAQRVWMRLADTVPPATLAEAKERAGELRVPERIMVRKDKTGRYWNVARWDCNVEAAG